jgi:hypothetical protein
MEYYKFDGESTNRSPSTPSPAWSVTCSAGTGPGPPPNAPEPCATTLSPSARARSAATFRHAVAIPPHGQYRGPPLARPQRVGGPATVGANARQVESTEKPVRVSADLKLGLIPWMTPWMA